MKTGFDNDKYLKMQSEYIKDRFSKFGDKLYLEFGGKLFDDFHASRVLPGFEPDSKLKMLLQLADQAEVIIVIGADAIEKNKKREDLGITYDKDVLRLIEEYRLYEFDTQKVIEPTGQVREIPQSPVLIEQVKPLTERQRVVFKYNLSRQMYSQNGVPFIYAAEGETYSSIADSYRLFLKEILRYNELEEDGEPAPGTVVYLQKKKNRSAPGLDKYVVEGQQSLREISQRFAIRLNKLCKLNGITEDHVLKEGDIISLR